MADEQKSEKEKGGKSGGRKRNRRRYFRRSKGKSSASDGKSKDGKGTQSKGQKRRSSNQRSRRRRRRSRSRAEDRSGPSIVQEIDTNYIPPESVFVYTHVLRPDQRDSYSFRSEFASGTGRQLDDFNIDLSSIFPEGAEPVPQTAANSVARATAQFKDADSLLLDDLEDEDDSGHATDA